MLKPPSLRALVGLGAIAIALINPVTPPQSVEPHTEQVHVAQVRAIAQEAKTQVRLAEHISAAWKVPRDLSQRIVTSVYVQAQEIGLAPSLLLALIAKESGFKPDATSSYGAVGLMQVVPRFHPEKLSGGESLNHPETNIRVGSRVLQEYLEKSGGKLEPALRKYSGSARAYNRLVNDFQQTFESIQQEQDDT